MNAVVALTLLAGQGLDRPRYGTASDLRGLTRAFIDTGTDVKARARIVRELRLSGAALDIVQELKDAAILLEFGASVEHRHAQRLRWPMRWSRRASTGIRCSVAGHDLWRGRHAPTNALHRNQIRPTHILR